MGLTSLFEILLILYYLKTTNSRIIPNLNNLNLDSPSTKNNVKSENDAMKYLNRFGYMDGMESMERSMDTNSNVSSLMMNSAVSDFQRFMGLPETGVLDEMTMNMMNKPRCGVADNLQSRTKGLYKILNKKSNKSRFRRYQLEGSFWGLKNITWKVNKYSSRYSLRGRDREVDAIMGYALNEWGRYSGIKFRQEKGNKKPIINIAFTVLDHRDGNPFDGPSGTLAHAFFPQFGGDTHFDDQEMWSINGGYGVDLLSVAVHEFGHALGLGHSDDKNSLMYPTYEGQRSKLKRDDINGIEKLYGKNQLLYKSPAYKVSAKRPKKQKPRKHNTRKRKYKPRRNNFIIDSPEKDLNTDENLEIEKMKNHLFLMKNMEFY